MRYCYQPISNPIRLFYTEKGTMGGFVHFSIIVEHPPWIYLGVGIIKLLIMVVIRLVLLLVMV